MDQEQKDTKAALPNLYAKLKPAQRVIVDRHLHLLQALDFPGIEDDVKFEHIRQMASSQQGLRVLSEAIAATEAWKEDDSIPMPKAMKMPKDAKDRHMALLKRHKMIILAADPEITTLALADSFSHANTPAGLQMLEQLEFLRQHAEEISTPRKTPRTREKATATAGMR